MKGLLVALCLLLSGCAMAQFRDYQRDESGKMILIRKKTFYSTFGGKVDKEKMEAKAPIEFPDLSFGAVAP